MKATAANMTTMRGTRTPGRKRHRSRDYTSRHRPDDLGRVGGFVAGGRGLRILQIAKSQIAFGKQIGFGVSCVSLGVSFLGVFLRVFLGAFAFAFGVWLGFVGLGGLLLG